jgi:hypothetical protein
MAEHEATGVEGRRVGLICNDEHDVFRVVADRLEDRGATVTFFEPGRRLSADEITDCDLLLNKKVDPASFDALRTAAREGVRTWNGEQTVRLGVRLFGYGMLEHVGFHVPEVFFERPDADVVAKTAVDWHFEPDPERNGDGDLYQRLVPAEPIDHKYYAADVGDEIVVQVLRTTSKLQTAKRPLEMVDPDPVLADRVRELLRVTDTQAIGVDVVYGEDGPWAVDVNPAMSFRHTGMEDELVDSILERLPSANAVPASANATD